MQRGSGIYAHDREGVSKISPGGLEGGRHLWPSRPRGADVWARSAFRLRGSPQRAGNLFARSAGMPKLHPVEGGVGQERGPLLHPDGLGYALILRATDPKEHDELSAAS